MRNNIKERLELIESLAATERALLERTKQSIDNTNTLLDSYDDGFDKMCKAFDRYKSEKVNYDNEISKIMKENERQTQKLMELYNSI